MQPRAQTESQGPARKRIPGEEERIVEGLAGALDYVLECKVERESGERLGDTDVQRTVPKRRLKA